MLLDRVREVLWRGRGGGGPSDARERVEPFGSSGGEGASSCGTSF